MLVHAAKTLMRRESMESGKWLMANREWLRESGKKKQERRGPRSLGLTRGGIQFNGRNNGKNLHIWRCYAKFAI